MSKNHYTQDKEMYYEEITLLPSHGSYHYLGKLQPAG